MVHFEKGKLVIEIHTSEPIWLWVELMNALFLACSAAMEAEELDDATKGGIKTLCYQLGEALAEIESSDQMKFEKAIE